MFWSFPVCACVMWLIRGRRLSGPAMGVYISRITDQRVIGLEITVVFTWIAHKPVP